MYVIVAFDISEESNREVVRRYLRSLGLSMVNRSVYAGVGGQSIAEKISEKVREKKIVKLPTGEKVEVGITGKAEIFVLSADENVKVMERLA
ncbi:MAG: CRISPR-associated endonuclease Cas2, partial [Nitrososphaerota archaeon]